MHTEDGAVRLSEWIAWQEIAGEVIVLDLDAGTLVGLNETGTFIFPRLESTPARAIATALAETFDVDLVTAEHDVAAFVDDLVGRGLARRTA